MSLRTQQDEDSTCCCAAIMRTVFQTHHKMDEFFNSNISDQHPSISSEYLKFLASNSGFKLVDLSLKPK